MAPEWAKKKNNLVAALRPKKAQNQQEDWTKIREILLQVDKQSISEDGRFSDLQGKQDGEVKVTLVEVVQRVVDEYLKFQTEVQKQKIENEKLKSVIDGKKGKNEENSEDYAVPDVNSQNVGEQNEDSYQAQEEKGSDLDMILIQKHREDDEEPVDVPNARKQTPNLDTAVSEKCEPRLKLVEDGWQTKVKALEDQLISQSEEHRTLLRASENHWRAEVRGLEEKIASQDKSYEIHIQSLQNKHAEQFANLRSQQESVETGLKAKLQNIEAERDKDIEVLEIELKEREHEVQRIRKESGSKITQLEKLTATMQQQNLQREQEWRQKHEEDYQRYIEADKAVRLIHQQEISDLLRKSEEANKLWQQNAEEQRRKYGTKISHAARVHQLSEERLSKEIESRNKALVARDKFSPMSDEQIQGVFSDLVHDVDELARLPWDSNKSTWTDELLQKTTDTPRRLKKYILLDGIWNVLYDHIFYSPFRMLGNGGKSLESDWSEAFGPRKRSKTSKTTSNSDLKDCSDLTWPTASFEAERWRFETIRSCQDAMNSVISEYDPRYKLRRSLQKTRPEITEKMAEVVREVSILDKQKNDRLLRIVENATNVWLNFGSQRCRLLVNTQNLEIEDASADFKFEGAGTKMYFVLRPEVRRIGDADGTSLDKEQVVRGCEGKAVLLNIATSA